jgi:hypothetical protein
MCFGKYKKKNKRQKYKINKIVPLRENKSKRDNYDRVNNHNKIKEEHSIVSNQRKEFHEKFIKEIIPCGFCSNKFNLGSNELQICCGGCDKFFHCHIGGKCQGENCSIIMPDGSVEYISYCLNCCDPYTTKNGFCICNNCSLKK